MLTHPQHPRDDLDGSSSYCGVLNSRVWDSCILKYFIGVEPDLKMTVTTRFIDRTKTQMLWNNKWPVSPWESKKDTLLIWCFHLIHQRDHHHDANHHSCIWDPAFHQHGLLTRAPLEINLCILINHTLLMQHPSLMRCRQDGNWCSKMLSCWFSNHTYTISSLFQHWRLYVLYGRRNSHKKHIRHNRTWHLLYCLDNSNSLT